MTREIKLKIKQELINEIKKAAEQKIKNQAIDDIYMSIVSEKVSEVLQELSTVNNWGKRELSKEVKDAILSKLNTSINKEIEKYVESSFGGKTKLEKIIEIKVNAFIHDIIEKKLEKIRDNLVVNFTN